MRFLHEAALRSASATLSAGRTLIATKRSRRVSRAFYTTPCRLRRASRSRGSGRYLSGEGMESDCCPAIACAATSIADDPGSFLRPAARTGANGPRAPARHRQRRHDAEMRRAPRPGGPTLLAAGYPLASIDPGRSLFSSESGLQRLDGRPPEIIALSRSESIYFPL